MAWNTGRTGFDAGRVGVWVVPIAEPAQRPLVAPFTRFFVELVGRTDTSSVDVLKVSVIQSDAWGP